MSTVAHPIAAVQGSADVVIERLSKPRGSRTDRSRAKPFHARRANRVRTEGLILAALDGKPWGLSANAIAAATGLSVWTVYDAVARLLAEEHLTKDGRHINARYALKAYELAPVMAGVPSAKPFLVLTELA